MQVGIGPVRRGLISHSPQKKHSPQFSAHICCGQMAGWIKMPLGMEVGLGPGDFVLAGNPARGPPQKGGGAANFWPMSIVAKRLDGSRWHLAGSWASIQSTLCEIGTQLFSPKKGQPPPIFGPYLLWPRSPITATALVTPLSDLMSNL